MRAQMAESTSPALPGDVEWLPGPGGARVLRIHPATAEPPALALRLSGGGERHLAATPGAATEYAIPADLDWTAAWLQWPDGSRAALPLPHGRHAEVIQLRPRRFARDRAPASRALDQPGTRRLATARRATSPRGRERAAGDDLRAPARARGDGRRLGAGRARGGRRLRAGEPVAGDIVRRRVSASVPAPPRPRLRRAAPLDGARPRRRPTPATARRRGRRRPSSPTRRRRPRRSGASAATTSAASSPRPPTRSPAPATVSARHATPSSPRSPPPGRTCAPPAPPARPTPRCSPPSAASSRSSAPHTPSRAGASARWRTRSPPPAPSWPRTRPARRPRPLELEAARAELAAARATSAAELADAHRDATQARAEVASLAPGARGERAARDAAPRRAGRPRTLRP